MYAVSFTVAEPKTFQRYRNFHAKWKLDPKEP